jgi:hypothetical protein
MFTRLALTALTGMTGRLLRRPRSRARRRAMPAGTTAPSGKSNREETAPPAEGGATPSPAAGPTQPSARTAAAIAQPDDHLGRARPRSNAPLLAAIAARSLPVLGVIGTLVTLVLAVGAVRGELPYVGAFETVSSAWAAAMVTISLWAVYLLWKVPQWQAGAWARSGGSNPRELFEIENESRGTLGQILSGVAVLTGLIFAWQQLGQTSDNLFVSQEGQITDRFSGGVGHLGSDNPTVRLGGIYALERIARDSPRDYGPVMEVLTGFARQQSPLPANADLADYDLRNTCWDRSDLRGATLARADLSNTTFAGSTLSQANLDGVAAEGASFNQADISLANLSRADLRNANLLAANLSTATLEGTDLGEANLLGTNLRNALLLGTDLSGANVLNADFTGAVLSGANLATVEGLTAEQIEPAIVDSATQLPPNIDVPPDL